MTFPLEKILTISGQEYAEISGEGILNNYDAVGVHFHGDITHSNLHEKFAEKVPANAEIVVGYRTNTCIGYDAYADELEEFGTAEGTALIKRK